VRVQVENLGPQADAEALGKTFEQVGDVMQAEISYDRDNRHTGWGYVVFG
jgi:hypothetical protein